MNTNSVSQYALTFAEATAAPHFHKISFRVRKKIFATLDEKENTLVVKLNEIDQSVFADIGGDHVYPVPGAWGKKGWTIIEYGSVQEELIKDAIKVSYCNVAPVSLSNIYLN